MNIEVREKSSNIFVNVPFSVYTLYILDLLSQLGFFVLLPFTGHIHLFLSQLGIFLIVKFPCHILLIYFTTWYICDCTISFSYTLDFCHNLVYF